MSRGIDQIKTRRKFLQMLSASPLLASPQFIGGPFANLLAAGELTERKFLGWLEFFQQSEEVISAPDEALDVMDFEPAARKALPADCAFPSGRSESFPSRRRNRRGSGRARQGSPDDVVHRRHFIH